jgi:hypothetical protein
MLQYAFYSILSGTSQQPEYSSVQIILGNLSNCWYSPYWKLLLVDWKVCVLIKYVFRTVNQLFHNYVLLYLVKRLLKWMKHESNTGIILKIKQYDITKYYFTQILCFCRASNVKLCWNHFSCVGDEIFYFRRERQNLKHKCIIRYCFAWFFLREF